MSTPQTVMAFGAYSTTQTTSSATVPRNPDGALAVNPDTSQPYQRVLVASTMTDDDAKNASNVCRIVLEASWDGGGIYETVDAPPYDWTGGLSPRDGSFTTPGETLPIPFAANGLPPTNVRAVVDPLGRTLNMSLALGFE